MRRKWFSSINVCLTECSSPTPLLFTPIPSFIPSFLLLLHLPHLTLFLYLLSPYLLLSSRAPVQSLSPWIFLSLHLIFSASLLITPSNLSSFSIFSRLLYSTCTSLLVYILPSSVSPFSSPSLLSFPISVFPPFLRSAPPQRAPGASPSAHNISSAAVLDRPNFSRGVGIRSTFHAGQQRGARDQQGSAYPGGPASPSLSHGNSQARRTHGATGIFSKFTSKFVRRWVKKQTGAWENGRGQKVKFTLCGCVVREQRGEAAKQVRRECVAQEWSL